MYSFIPQIFTEIYFVRRTSHMLALSDRGQQRLFFPLTDDDDGGHGDGDDGDGDDVVTVVVMVKMMVMMW